MLEIWQNFIILALIYLGCGILCIVGAFFIDIFRHIRGQEVTRGTYKAICIPTLIMIAAIFVFACLLSAVFYFDKSWEHINAEPVKINYTIDGIRIDVPDRSWKQ